MSWLNNPIVKLGYAEAIVVSAKYEAERGRPAQASVNFGLARYMSETKGLRAVGGMVLAEELTGSRPTGKEVAEAHATGKMLNYHESTNSWYLD